mmetsp:Transcript_37436/g.105684  ORF Transcript_37436/g.105684 Transcript_37436/m.105684 type:complete len:295 (+) Transcript_37436:115-999(+)
MKSRCYPGTQVCPWPVCKSLSLPCDHCANALVSEELLEKGVGLAAVHDVGGVHTLGKGTDAAVHLWQHAAIYDALPLELLAFPDIEFPVQAADVVLVLHHARNVRHEDELLCLQGGGDLACRCVSIDVEGLAPFAGGHCCDDWNGVALHKGANEASVHPCHLAHKPDVLLHHLPCKDRLPILAAHADGIASSLIDEGDDALVHPANKHHLHQVHGGAIRHPQAVLEVWLYADLLKPRVDLRAASMDKHRADANAGQEYDVCHDSCLEPLILHSGAAVFDHDGLASELLEVWKGF